MGEGRKFDGDKERYDLIPMECIEDLAKILTMGANKYEPDNWQRLENGEDRYFAALMRHLVASRKGEKIDIESGLSHLAHAMCNVVFLLWLEKHKYTKIGDQLVDKSKMKCSELECSKD